MTDDDTDLWSAYSRANYLVFADADAVCIRVGHPTPDVDRLLERRGDETWAFITACNPGSVPLDDATNAIRQAELEAEVDAMGYERLEARGEEDGGPWFEPSVFVAGIDEERAVALARRYGQNAIVVGRTGERARLVDCRPREGL